jgi:hypothetical protein
MNGQQFHLLIVPQDTLQSLFLQCRELENAAVFRPQSFKT